MTKAEAIKILAVLTAAYPHAYKNMSDDEANGVVMVWTIQFADVPADIVFMALNKAISSCKFPPSISEVKSRISAIHWEAYEALRQNDATGTLAPGAVRDYKRIFELTSAFKTHSKEPDLSEMLIGNTHKYLE